MKITEGERKAEEIMLKAYRSNGRIRLNVLPECCRHILLAYGTFGNYLFDGEKDSVRGYYLDKNGVKFCAEGCFSYRRKERKWLNLRSWIGSVIGVLGFILGVITFYKSCNNPSTDAQPSIAKPANAITPNMDVSITIADSAKCPNREPQNTEYNAKEIKSIAPNTKTITNVRDSIKSIIVCVNDK